MSGDDYGRIAYLVLLLVAVGGWFIAESRGNLSKSVRQFLIWGLIFVGIIAAYGLWGDIQDDIAPRQAQLSDGSIEVPLGVDGHYHLTLRLNDVPVNFIVDTGASDVVLSLQDAARVGLSEGDLNFNGTASTANGIVRTADVNIGTIELGSILDTNFPVSVNQGELDISLLGMSYLRRFESIEIRNNRLLLNR